MNYIKVEYEKIKIWGVTLPVYHTFLEVKYKGKVRKFGFKTRRKLRKYWPVTIFIPLKGMVKNETFKPDYSTVLTCDKRKIKKLLKILEKFHWEYYHMLAHNCFEWRDSVLKAAGIIPPLDNYLNPAKRRIR